MAERIVRPHDFWLLTCGLDTHRRGPNYARLDTPWNAFTSDGQKLVCTLWTDLIVEVYDSQLKQVRRFVKMGGRSKKWVGVGKQHGEQARSNQDRATENRLSIFGYEAEPNSAELEKGVRSVKNFYLNRAHRMKPWIGLSLYDLDQRLHIENAFHQKGIVDSRDPNMPSTLFELVNSAGEAPGTSAAEASIQEEISEEQEVVQEFEGNLSTEEYARNALSLLVAHLLQQTDGVLEPMTYLRLAEQLGRRNKHGTPWARGLGHVLGRVTTLIDSVAPNLPEKPPYLTTIVVLSKGKNAGLPDKGVSGRWPGYDLLSKDDKRAKVDGEYQRILRYGSRWNDVLRLIGLEAISAHAMDGLLLGPGGWGSGESDDHKALKRFVCEHPELVGAAKDWVAREEYDLRSLDVLDVMFKSDRVWIGVEVKSKVSDRSPADYERGIYQVVKYKAVLEAQAQVDFPENPPQVLVVLATESHLPTAYRSLANSLSVPFIEDLVID